MKRDTLIDIYKDIGQVTFATLLIQPIFNLDQSDTAIIILGSIVTLYFWFLSLIISR